MGLIRHDWKSRQQLRDNLEDNPFFKASITPVLLMFWTKESLDMFLIPATPEERQILLSVHGVDMYGEDWELLKNELNFIANKIALPYNDDEGKRHEVGEWRDRYYVDTHDDQGNKLLPLSVPPGTMVVVTGAIIDKVQP